LKYFDSCYIISRYIQLTLAAVYDITNDEKKDRLISHLRYAEEHGVLDEVEEYLKGLSDDHWAYEKDRQPEGH